MGYSLGRTLLKVLKNLGILMAAGALTAGSDGVAEVAIELGVWAPLFILGVQMGFNILLDYLKHKE